jgi:hypothetical protein
MFQTEDWCECETCSLTLREAYRCKNLYEKVLKRKTGQRTDKQIKEDEFSRDCNTKGKINKLSLSLGN